MLLKQDRKKLVKEEESTRNTPLPLVTRLVKDIGGKVANVLPTYQFTHYESMGKIRVFERFKRWTW